MSIVINSTGGGAYYPNGDLNYYGHLDNEITSNFKELIFSTKEKEKILMLDQIGDAKEFLFAPGDFYKIQKIKEGTFKVSPLKICDNILQCFTEQTKNYFRSELDIPFQYNPLTSLNFEKKSYVMFTNDYINISCTPIPKNSTDKIDFWEDFTFIKTPENLISLETLDSQNYQISFRTFNEAGRAIIRMLSDIYSIQDECSIDVFSGPSFSIGSFQDPLFFDKDIIIFSKNNKALKMNKEQKISPAVFSTSSLGEENVIANTGLRVEATYDNFNNSITAKVEGLSSTVPHTYKFVFELNQQDFSGGEWHSNAPTPMSFDSFYTFRGLSAGKKFKIKATIYSASTGAVLEVRWSNIISTPGLEPLHPIYLAEDSGSDYALVTFSDQNLNRTQGYNWYLNAKFIKSTDIPEFIFTDLKPNQIYEFKAKEIATGRVGKIEQLITEKTFPIAPQVEGTLYFNKIIVKNSLDHHLIAPKYCSRLFENYKASIIDISDIDFRAAEYNGDLSNLFNSHYLKKLYYNPNLIYDISDFKMKANIPNSVQLNPYPYSET